MSIRRVLLKAFRRRRLEQDMEAELAFHRDMARHHANPIGLGNITRIQEEARDLWRFTFLEDFWRDFIYALRSLARSAGFAVVAVLTLALGIGANTAMFTLTHRIMLASLPVDKPGELIEVLGTRGAGPTGVSFSYAALKDLRRGSQTSSILGFSSVTFHALIDGEPMERLSAEFVTGDYFSTLGVRALRGRALTPRDDRAGDGTAVAMISHSLWQSRFGGLPDAIGKTIILETIPYTIVGITDAAFTGVEAGRQTDVWVPLESERLIRRPSRTTSTASKWIQMIGRLKPEATIEEATAELRVLYAKSIAENDIPETMASPRFDPSFVERMKTWSLILAPAGSGLSRTRDQYAQPLTVLMGIVAVLLLIACTNVAYLLIARARSREREMAMRLSLGAGQFRLIRQLFAESFVLVAAGGLLAVFLAYLLTRHLTTFLAGAIVLDVTPNPATLGFTAAVSIVAAVLFSIMPALRNPGADFMSRVKGGMRLAGDGGNQRWSRGLIVAQVALLMVLVIGAGLFLRTLHNLNSIDLGFNRSNVLLAFVDPFGATHSQPTMMALTAQLLERIETLPGVNSASLTRFAPVSGGTGTNLDFRLNREGVDPADPVIARGVWVNTVGPRYFATLGVPVIAGREFDSRDSEGATPVVMINQAFADRYFGRLSPIGRVIYLQDMPLEIVGLVRDSKYSEIRETVEPAVYRSLFQQFNVPVQLVIRTEGNPELITASVRAEAQSIIGRTVTIRARTLEEHIDATIARERLVTRMAALFGGLALLLAVIGLYGVVSNSVTRRTREIGIRLALGFDPRSAVSMVLHEIFVLVGAGIAIGLPLAVLMTRSIDKLLYGLSTDDPITIVVSVCALLLAAFAAGFIPARRAARVDPAIALRNE